MIAQALWAYCSQLRPQGLLGRQLGGEAAEFYMRDTTAVARAAVLKRVLCAYPELWVTIRTKFYDAHQRTALQVPG